MAEDWLGKVKRATAIIHILQSATKGMTEPAVTQIVNKYGRDPFLILVSCVLSLRTKDTVSLPASLRLFDQAKKPAEILDLSLAHIEKIIYPVGFYRQKAKSLHGISKKILADFAGVVPNDQKDLLSLPGVGRKTMNLVMGEAFGIPSICVDTHVHRISNRLGLVATTSPEETEQALMKLLPPEYWVEYNRLMVMWGQNICLPVLPRVSQCAVKDLCPRVGVKKYR